MFPDDLLEKNRAFATGREAEPLPAAGTVELAVVSCFDPRLDPLLRPALGLEEGEAFFIRTAGALIPPDSEPLRSLAVAVYLFEVRRVLILGHSSCRMADFPTQAFVEACRRRGVGPDAFGGADPDTWAGALASPRDGVLASARAIAEAPFLPSDLELTGAVLDDTSGRIEIVLRPEQAPIHP